MEDAEEGVGQRGAIDAGHGLVHRQDPLCIVDRHFNSMMMMTMMICVCF